MSKMQRFHTDMADAGLQHCLDADSEFNPYRTALPEDRLRPVLDLSAAGGPVSPSHAAGAAESAAASPAPPPTAADSPPATGAGGARGKKSKKSKGPVARMQPLLPVHHFDDKELYRMELQLWMHDQSNIKSLMERRRQWVKDRGILFGKLSARLHTEVKADLETHRLTWATQSSKPVSDFGYDELLRFLKQVILVGEGTQQFLPLFELLDCRPVPGTDVSGFRDKFCNLGARVSAPVSSGGLGPEIQTKVLLGVLAVWRMQQHEEFADFLRSVAKYDLTKTGTYDKMMSDFRSQQSLLTTKVVIKKPSKQEGQDKQPRPRRAARDDDERRGRAFGASERGFGPCEICGHPTHGRDFCFGPGGGREDEQKFLQSIQARQKIFDSRQADPGRGRARAAVARDGDATPSDHDKEEYDEQFGPYPPAAPDADEHRVPKARRGTQRRGRAKMSKRRFRAPPCVVRPAATCVGSVFGLNKKHYEMKKLAEFLKVSKSVFSRDKSVIHTGYAVLDSGATGNYFKPGFAGKHGIGSRVVKDSYIEQAAGDHAEVEREATANFKFANASQTCVEAKIDFCEVTNLTENLFSLIERLDARTQFCLRHDLDGGSWMQLPGHAERIPIHRVGDALHVMFGMDKIEKLNLNQINERNHFLHRCCAHFGDEVIAETKKRGMVRNFDYTPSLDAPGCRCKTCLATKAERAPFPKEARSRAPKPGIRLHFDNKEVRAASRRGFHFRVTCTDDHTRYEWSSHQRHIRNLHDTVEKAVEFYEQLGWDVRTVMCDVQFITHAMRSMCARHGCKVIAAPPRTHAPNGVIENKHKQWARGVRAILNDQNRGTEDWADASECYEQIKNCLYTSAAPNSSPYEGVFLKKPNFEHFQIPLCDCWYFVYPEERNGPFPDRREKGMYVGMDLETDSYRIFNRDRGIYYSRRYEDVVFQRPREVYEHDVNDDVDPAVPSIPGVLIDEDEDDSDYNQGSESDSSGESSSSAESSSSSSDDEGDGPASGDLGVSIWVDDQTSKWNAAKFATKCNIEFDAFVAMQSKNQRIAGFRKRDCFEAGTELRIPAQAAAYIERDIIGRARIARWGTARAAARELQDLGSVNPGGTPEEFGTMGMTKPPKNYRAAHPPDDDMLSRAAVAAERKQIGKLSASQAWLKVPLKFARERMLQVHNTKSLVHFHWVYALKPTELAARLVYPGNRFKFGADGDNAATVLRWEVAKLMMLVGTEKNQEIESADANAAFMNSMNNVEEYAYLPEGHYNADIPIHPDFTDVMLASDEWAVLVNKMWYGKENAPKAWSNIRDEDMLEGGRYEQSKHNDCLFKNVAPPGFEVECEHKVGILVDDYLSVGHKNVTDAFMDRISKKWSMKIQGDVHGREFMGVRIHRDREKRVIEFDQERAILDFLKEWGMSDCKGRDSPMDANLTLPKLEGKCENLALQKEYRSKVGSILQFMRMTRADITYPIVYLSCFQANPSAVHMDAVNQLMRYLKQTAPMRQRFDCSDPITKSVYMACDANWDVESWAGGHINIFGAAWTYWAKKIKLVMHSSTASEYYSVDLGVRELVYLRNLLLDDFGIELPVIPVLEDNQSCICMANGPVMHNRTKHMDIRFHYIRECTRPVSGESTPRCRMQYHPTNHMSADVLTKALGRKLFERHARVLMGHAEVSGLEYPLFDK